MPIAATFKRATKINITPPIDINRSTDSNHLERDCTNLRRQTFPFKLSLEKIRRICRQLSHDILESTANRKPPQINSLRARTPSSSATLSCEERLVDGEQERVNGSRPSTAAGTRIAPPIPTKASLVKPIRADAQVKPGPGNKSNSINGNSNNNATAAFVCTRA